VVAPESKQRLPRRERSNKACGMLSLQGKRGRDASCENCSLWDSGRSAQQSGDARGEVWGGNEPPMHVVCCHPSSTRSLSRGECSCPRDPEDKPPAHLREMRSGGKGRFPEPGPGHKLLPQNKYQILPTQRKSSTGNYFPEC